MSIFNPNNVSDKSRLERSSTLQVDSEIRKELNLEHASLEFLQEPLIPKNPPKNTCFELKLLQPCSKKEDPVTLSQMGRETIAILSQDNFVIAYTDGSSDNPSAMEVPESSYSPQMNSCTAKENPVSCNGYPHMSTLRVMNVPIVSPKKLETSIISAPPSHLTMLTR
ncbi:hypothetical protein TNCV_4030531 [Trichonephila clavipes]|nr:hypothetical protein TNCV_4030531 [Trichonephila clavipes]